MLKLAMRAAAFAGVSPRAQRVLGWLILILAAAILICIGVLLFRGWISGERREAVKIDRASIEGAAREASHAADRRAANDKHIDELTAERARADQMEAINASLHDPGADPLDAALNRMRQ